MDYAVGQKVTVYAYNDSDPNIQCVVTEKIDNDTYRIDVSGFMPGTISIECSEHHMSPITVGSWVLITAEDGTLSWFRGTKLQVRRMVIYNSRTRWWILPELPDDIWLPDSLSSISDKDVVLCDEPTELEWRSQPIWHARDYRRPFMITGVPESGYAVANINGTDAILIPESYSETTTYVPVGVVISPMSMAGQLHSIPVWKMRALTRDEQVHLMNSCICCGRESNLNSVYANRSPSSAVTVAQICDDCASYVVSEATGYAGISLEELNQLRRDYYGLQPVEQSGVHVPVIDDTDPDAQLHHAIQEHFTRCVGCGGIFVRDSYEWLCRECRSEIESCEVCGDMHLTVNMTSYDDGYVCSNPSCVQAHARTALRRNGYQYSYIHRYLYKPAPNFLKQPTDDDDDWYFGVELEIDASSDNETGYDPCSADLHALDEDENFFYQKHDGSLSGDGIEIVTHPASYKYHMMNFPWQEIINVALAHDYASHDTTTCGMHVHVSRSAFGVDKATQDLNIAKAIFLFDKYWDNLVNFSRRKKAALTHYANKPNAQINTGDQPDVAREKFSKYVYANERYRAINLCNENTVEFRIFRGTLVLDTIKATLQFLRGLILYVRNHDLLQVYNAQWMDFCCGDNERELIAYLKSRNLFTGQCSMNLDAIQDYN